MIVIASRRQKPIENRVYAVLLHCLVINLANAYKPASRRCPPSVHAMYTPTEGHTGNVSLSVKHPAVKSTARRNGPMGQRGSSPCG